MSALNLTVERIDASADTLITNLFDLYMHDMAEWFLFDIGDEGRFRYDMSKHWARDDEVYIARCGGKLAGFVLVTLAKNIVPESDGYDVEEFFVVRRYRRSGVGEALARAIWDMHHGQWLVRVYEGNLPAIPFWRKIISSYTNDRQIEERRIANNKAWSYFHFRNDVS